MADMFKVIKMSWSALRNIPGGKRIFSKIVSEGAPYTATIGAQVQDLGHGHSLIALTQRRKVSNHLGSIHAIALANLAELAGNLALVYSMPPKSRFIVARMEIDYVKKARGRILAEGRVDVPDAITENIDLQSHITIRDAQGDVVVKAVCFCKVGPVG